MTTDAESRYAPNEDESLEFVYCNIFSSLSHVIDAAPEAETDIEQSVRFETMMLLSDIPQLTSVIWDRIKAADLQNAVGCDRNPEHAKHLQIATIVHPPSKMNRSLSPNHQNSHSNLQQLSSSTLSGIQFSPVRRSLYCLVGDSPGAQSVI